MGDKKFYVYSARTTLEGLKQLNELKAKLNIHWDKLINDAVCEKYGLDPMVINVPPSEFLQKREAEKAQKTAVSTPPAANEPKTEPQETAGVTNAQEAPAEEQKKKQPADKKKGGKKAAADMNQVKVEKS